MRVPGSENVLLVTAVLLGFSLAACGGGEEPEEDLPIVVEDSGPIALGEETIDELGPEEEEVEFVEEEPEPEVITRTVIIREPAPTPPPEATPEPAEEEPAEEPAPEPVTQIPAGTQVPVTLVAQVDSEHNEVGDPWTGRVARDVMVRGEVVIPRGASVSGVIMAIDEGDDNEGQGSITLVARSMETIAGTRAIAAAPAAGGHSYTDKGFPGKETAIGAGVGAAIGGIIGGGKGAAIGAAAGGAGGAAMGAARVDYEVAMPEGSTVTFRLESAVVL